MKGRGRFTAPPATILMAMASPRALPMPSTTPVRMPDLAAGTVTRRMVCILLAPRAREAARREPGTARMAEALTLMTVGRIMMARTITAASRSAPPVYRWVEEPANRAFSSL